MLISTSLAISHEFWLRPQKYQLESGAPIVAELLGGQKFSGGPFSYVPDRFVRFDFVQGEQVVAVQGRIGDRPAANMPVPNDGLWVIVHETTDSKLTYQDWETFAGFVKHKDLGNTLAQHEARGLPRYGFRESYRRFIKALVAVGDGQGADGPVGLRTEIVALANPYTDDLTNGLPVQVLFEGAPRINAQLEVFDRGPDGQVTITTQHTDDQGQTVVAVQSGHEYLLDAVKMLRLDTDNPSVEPVWKSLWAALTFAVPGEGK